MVLCSVSIAVPRTALFCIQKPLMLCLESAEATLPSLGWQLLMFLLPLRPLWTLPS